MCKYLIPKLFVLCLLCGCVEEQPLDKTGKTIKVDISSLRDVSLEDLAFSTDQVTLKISTDGQSVGEISSVIVRDNTIYVMDGFKTMCLYIYDLDGNMIRVIDKKGRAMNEYTQLSCFDVDNIAKEIIILDSNLRKLLFYDYDGNYIRKLELPNFASHFILAENNSILLNCGNNTFDVADKNYSLILIDRETGKRLDAFLEIPKSKANLNISALSPLYRSEDCILYQPSASCSLYEVSNKGVKGKYTFDFMSNWPKEEFFSRQSSNSNMMSMLKEFKDNNYILFPNIIENTDCVAVSFSYHSKKMVVVYDKKSDKTMVLDASDETKISPPIASFGDKFISMKYYEDKNPSLFIYSLSIAK